MALDGSIMVGDAQLLREYGEMVVAPSRDDVEFERLRVKGYYVPHGSSKVTYRMTERGQIALGRGPAKERATAYGPGSEHQR